MIPDRVIAVDWSALSKTGPKAATDNAIYVCNSTAAAPGDPVYYRTRSAAMAAIEAALDAALLAAERVVLGFDFAFGYPAGFVQALTGGSDPFALWKWMHDHIQDDDANANDRYEVAAQINGRFPGVGPFWGHATGAPIQGLPRKGNDRAGHGMPERRAVETAAPGAKTVWQLSYSGAVGSQSLLGLRRLHGLRMRYGADLSVWPFEDRSAPITLVEIYPSLMAKGPDVPGLTHGDILDAQQVRKVCDTLLTWDSATWARMCAIDALEEGWILGVPPVRLGGDASPAQSAPLKPPALSNDCFAMPQGVAWTPVEAGLAHLRRTLHPVAVVQEVPLGLAAGRLLAKDVKALRDHPPFANSAVDGYGFAGPAASGAHLLPLQPGRAAAGAPFSGSVPKGAALRILTGAAVPPGVDTVVLEEDCRVNATHVAFQGPLKRGANIRPAGEDVQAGSDILAQGRRLTPADVGLLAATAVARVPCRVPLRVAIFSTGDEVVDIASALEAVAAPGQIYDANRPMLQALIASWGMEVVDLGILPDDPAAIRAALDAGAANADAIVTSGGASAGDEDHISALLRQTGSMAVWRLALKPGRPLALGLWSGVPVFGLPGNPVAAMVCALVFARPALGLLAGAQWHQPAGVMVPAAFTKRKKAGRREYLRARLNSAGHAEVFASEGSGRISGLSWATGLVELDDAAADITLGDMVRFHGFEGGL